MVSWPSYLLKNDFFTFLFWISSQEIENQIDRICEMGEVMRKAVQMDDDQFCKIQEKLAQLEVRLLPF